MSAGATDTGAGSVGALFFQPNQLLFLSAAFGFGATDTGAGVKAFTGFATGDEAVAFPAAVGFGCSRASLFVSLSKVSLNFVSSACLFARAIS